MRATALFTLFLALVPSCFALEKTAAKKALTKIGSLKSLDLEDVMCDECLEEIDCIWPCEMMCVLDLPEDFMGIVCQACLEFFGCQGCKFMCPTPTTDAPTSFPTSKPTIGPTSPPTEAPTSGPTAEPTTPPTPAPSEEPSPQPTQSSTLLPSSAPSTPPTAKPTDAPSPKPSVQPSAYPTYSPTTLPERSYFPSVNPSVAPTVPPTPMPSSEPTAEPTAAPTVQPTPSPDFWVYYSCEDNELYSYNPVNRDSTFLYTDDFAGDLKVDSVNKLMFWTAPNNGHVVRYDLTDDTDEFIITGYDGLMGLALDPSTGDIYFADDNNLCIMITDYTGSNISTVHELVDYGIQPFGIEISPAETGADILYNDPGTLFFTAIDDLYGYIVSSNLFGGEFEILYTTTSKAIYGIVQDPETAQIWWVENRGVANGLYSAMDDGSEQMFVSYLEDSKWIAAIWDLELFYIADTMEGTVYELDISLETGEVESTLALAYCDEPRVIAYYYETDVDDVVQGIAPGDGVSDTPSDPANQVEGEAPDGGVDGALPPSGSDSTDGAEGNPDGIGGPSDSEALEASYRAKYTAKRESAKASKARRAAKKASLAEDVVKNEEESTAENNHYAFPAVALVALVVAGVAYSRRNRQYSTIQDSELTL